MRSRDSSPGNVIAADTPAEPCSSPKIGLTSREAAAAVGRTIKRLAKGKSGDSPRKTLGKKQPALSTGEIVEDPFQGVVPAGRKDKNKKKSQPVKVQCYAGVPLLFPQTLNVLYISSAGWTSTRRLAHPRSAAKQIPHRQSLMVMKV